MQQHISHALRRCRLAGRDYWFPEPLRSDWLALVRQLGESGRELSGGFGLKPYQDYKRVSELACPLDNQLQPNERAEQGSVRGLPV